MEVEIGIDEEDEVGNRIFTGKIWVVLSTRIEGIGLRVILWPIDEVVKDIGLFHSEVLK